MSPGEVSLRPLAAEDAPLLQLWRSEPSVRRYQPLAPLSAGQLRTEIAARRPSDLYRGRGSRFDWVISAGARPVGWITLVIHSWDHGLAECGYALSTAYHGRGIMTHALRQLLAELFRRTSLHRIEARCAVDNVASQRVLEKLGFVCEGTLRGYFELDGARVDNLLYALLRGELLPDESQEE